MKGFAEISDFVTKQEHYTEALNKVKGHFREEDKFKDEFIIASPKISISKMILDRIIRKYSESVDW